MNVYGLRTIGVVLYLTGLVIFGTSSSVESQVGGGAATASQMVKGDVLNIEDDYYVIKDITGHEMRLHVNKDTKMEDRIKVGDKIEAQLTSDGHVTSMRVHIPNAVPSTSTSPNQLP